MQPCETRNSFEGANFQCKRQINGGANFQCNHMREREEEEDKFEQK